MSDVSRDPVRFIRHEPVFRVADVIRAVEHYQQLGFETEFHDAGYAFATFGKLTIHLARDGGEGWPGYPLAGHMSSVLYIHVDDVDRLATQWRAAGAAVTGPRNEDYGQREAYHVDPDGNLIRFGSPLE